MSRRGSVLVAAGASALGFALIAWVASADSLQMLQSPSLEGGPPTFSGPTPTPRPTQTFGSGRATPEPSRAPGPDLAWVDALLMVLALTAALIVVALLARWVWRQGWLKRRRHLDEPPEVPFEVLPEVALALATDAPAAPTVTPITVAGLLADAFGYVATDETTSAAVVSFAVGVYTAQIVCHGKVAATVRDRVGPLALDQLERLG